MICEKCGKELTKVGEFTDKEIDEFAYICEKEATANQAMNPAVVNSMEFDDGKLFEYFRSAFDAKAQAQFLKHIFMRDLRKRLGVDIKTNIIFNSLGTGDKSIYAHPIHIDEEK